MAKTEVYSWRLAPEKKAALERKARAGGKTIAQVLDALAEDWLASGNADNLAEQRRLHAAAAKFAGAISGNDPHRSRNVSALVRRKLRQKHGR